MEKYEVIWPHQGDQAYKPGDIREAHPASVGRLVKNGTLVLIKDEKPKPKTKAATKTKTPTKAKTMTSKSQPAPKNKAEAPPINKAQPSSPKNKRGLFGRKKK